MADTITIGWGKPKIEVKKVGDSAYVAFATPVEDSTQLETTQGDKLEAKIEGGENEAVRYKANTYQLTFQVRQAPERTDPIVDVDGVVADEYTVMVTPENPDAIGCVINRAAVNVQTTFNAAEGLVKTYTFDVLKPASGNQVKLQVIEPT
ncbi:MAG: hypothetical protein LBK45_02925 [Tannerellaceae bacterium]|jgi:hypothetical protein|nr:hypothetical protein [Tannerellaceae bacterium]